MAFSEKAATIFGLTSTWLSLVAFEFAV